MATPVLQEQGLQTLVDSIKEHYIKNNGTVGSGTNPIYFDGNTLKALTSTVGSSSIPVWLNNGILTACSAGIDAIAQVSKGFYIRFSNGIIIQGGYANDTSQQVEEVELPLSTNNAYTALSSENTYANYYSRIHWNASSVTITKDNAGDVVYYLVVGN